MTKEELDRELILESLFSKWNPICLGCHTDQGSRDCPLCIEYEGEDCCSAGCPIAAKVGISCCRRTPYINYVALSSTDKERYTFAEEEVEFLISLLDKETQENLEEIFIGWCKKG